MGVLYDSDVTTSARIVLGIPFSALALGCAGLQLTEVQNSSTKPSNVAVYFKVETSKGDPVPGLTAEQFNIYEDDTIVSIYESKQTILNPEVAASHYTLLLVDMSGSVSESEDAATVVEAAKVFSGRVEKNNKLAIYAFDGSEDLHKISGFTDSASGAEARANALGGFKAKDPSTNLNGAIVKGLEELDRGLQSAENPLKFGTLVVFTDGTDRAARVSEADMAQTVADSPYEVFAIGMGAEISESALGRIGKSGTATASDSEAVVKAFDEIGAKVEGVTRSYYLLSYCSPARAGEHSVRIEAVASDPKNGKERKGSMETRFDATGFDKGCDPNTPPKFDVTKGDALVQDKPGTEPSKKTGKTDARASHRMGTRD